MKKLCLVAAMALMLSAPAFCEGFGYSYVDEGSIYTNTTLPASVAKAVNLQDSGFVNVSNKSMDLLKLKKGVSTRTNILWLVETGDGGIMAAARNGGILKVHYVEQKNVKIYVPIGFIPIYVKGVETHVYGE